MNNEMEQLLQSVAYGPRATGGFNLPSFEELASSADTWKDTAVLAMEAAKLVEAATASKAGAQAPPMQRQTSSESQDGGVGGAILKTAAMMTGVGPVVAGLLKIFGSSDPEPVPALEKFSAPTPISVEAGLTRDRQYSALRYTENGAQALGGASRGAGEAASIQVNIQALDSQSFLDRQDDIARAVREAMLHSNSLNDVVMEL